MKEIELKVKENKRRVIQLKLLKLGRFVLFK